MVAALALLVTLAAPATAAVDVPRDVVRLQGLDKVTARVSTFDVAVGRTVRFGTLEVTPEICFEAPPTEAPESAAFLQIVDDPPEARPVEVFSGWMFASSPALSALEHPVLDVWVVDCLARAELAEEQAPAEVLADDRGPPRRRP